MDTTVAAGEADAEPPRRRLVKWNRIDGPFSTLRIGMGFLVDFVAYEQDAESRQQFPLESDAAVRDFRFVLDGALKTERKITWCLGYMYDGAADKWRFRQTGIELAVPELSGRIFVGRSKEGYALVKVMNGYHPWSMERSPAHDAFIPILADGITWKGYFPGPRIYFSIAGFADVLSEDESFSSYDHQLVTRLVWQPVLSDEEDRVLHVGVMNRVGRPDEGVLQVRSRPEMFLAPYFLDTGKMTSDRAWANGIEVFYRWGPWLWGGDYNWHQVDTAGGERPLFHAGDTVLVWLVTGETRAYNAPGAFFKAVSPARPMGGGGWGAVEAVLRFSYSDFDSGTFRGGTFWRLTPMVNWHLTDNVRLEAVYGYGRLDRFGLEGATQFLQGRIQTVI